MEKRTYTYRNKFIFHIMPMLMLYLSFPFFLLLSIAYIIEIVTGNFVIGFEPVIKRLIAVLMPLIIPIFFSTELNMFPVMKLDHEGMLIRIFTFRWVWRKIPLNDVVGIKISERKYRGGNVWLVQISTHLTIWHKIIGKMFGQGKKSYIYVTHLLLDVDEFVEEISKKTKST